MASTTADSYADGSVSITVAGQDYTVTASPAPIPVDTTIAQLVLTTTDANGAPVPGVFTLVDGLRNPKAFRSSDREPARSATLISRPTGR